MKRISLSVLVILLLLASQTMASKVTNVELSYQENTTVARIDIDGKVRFIHSTEVPKNGKPDRIIVDVLSATHELGAKEFASLPKCAIRAVRSSQYSVTPEQVVRIVFDMKQTPIYRVDSDDKSVWLYINNKAGQSFKVWSSAASLKLQKPGPIPGTKPPATAAYSDHKAPKKGNAGIEEDRLLSLATEYKSPAKTVPATKKKAETTPVAKRAQDKKAEKAVPVVKTETKKLTKKSEPAKAKPVTADKNLPKAEKAVAKKTEAKSNDKKTYAEKAPYENKSSSPKPSSYKKAPATDPKKKSKAPVLAAKKTQTTKSTPPPASKPADNADKKTVAAKPADDKSQPKKKSTARFRRDSKASNKIKGTMVAEFPKRLVINYKAKGRRDPFQTLVDATRTYDSPMEQRVPNIEGLKLVGVIESGTDGNRALFEDNESYGYILESGDKVRNGYVLRVESDRVYFQIFEYGWSRTVALTME